MGLLSLVYGTNKKLQIAQIEVDVCISESHDTDCDITENPIEMGAAITDHVQVKPAKVSIEGLVSDTPIKFLAGIRDILDDNKSRKTYEELLEIQNNREPIELITGLKKYNNMILKSLTVPRNADTGRALRFNAVFHEVLIVESSEVSLSNTDPKFNKKTGLGKKTLKTPSTGAAAAAGSLLSRLAGVGA